MKKNLLLGWRTILLTFLILGGRWSHAQTPTPCELYDGPTCYSVEYGVSAYFDVVLDFDPGVSAFALMPGETYNGWCLSSRAPIETTFDYCFAIQRPATNSAELPAYHQSPNWDIVNYLLNNKAGLSTEEVQLLIWAVLESRPLPDALVPVYDSLFVLGEGFVPSVGEIFGVILDLQNDRVSQPVLVEAICTNIPPPPPPDDEEICLETAVPNDPSKFATLAMHLDKVAHILVTSGSMRFAATNDGTATLTGKVVNASSTSSGFTVNISFSGHTTVAPSSNPSGGADTSDWSYYTNVTGTLTGFGAYNGVVLSVNKGTNSFQIGTGANQRNGLYGAYGAFEWQRLSGWHNYCQPSKGFMLIRLQAGDCIEEQLPCVGTGTIGYWKQHPGAWPVQTITVGGVEYSKDEAISLMPGGGDKSAGLFSQLVAAMLNTYIGNLSLCVDDEIAAANLWLETYPPGSGVTGGSDEWAVASPWHTKLDNYNNGLLCAPSRDTLDDKDCGKICPTAPSDLEVKLNSHGKLVVTWEDNSPAESGYWIERKINNGSWTRIGWTSPNGTTYTDNVAVCEGFKYCYRVTTKDCPEYSNTDCIEIPKVTCPRPPSNLCVIKVESGKVVIQWKDNSSIESGYIIERKVSGGSWTQIATVGANVTSHTDTTVLPCKTYYYRVRSSNCADYSGSVCVTTPKAPTPPKDDCNGYTPSPWKNKDVGYCGIGGGHGYKDGCFTLKGSGSDIWGHKDGFRYSYQSASGDCEIKAKVSSIGNTDPWAKAGIMIRESLNENSKHAFACLTPGNGLAFQRRCLTGGASEHTSGGNGYAWVKLVRKGDTFTSYKSKDGKSWIKVGSCTIKMASNVYIGLAVTSHNNSKSCEAKFTGVSVKH